MAALSRTVEIPQLRFETTHICRFSAVPFYFVCGESLPIHHFYLRMGFILLETELSLYESLMLQETLFGAVFCDSFSICDRIVFEIFWCVTVFHVKNKCVRS